ncbi:Mre11 [Entamoeba marina]
MSLSFLVLSDNHLGFNEKSLTLRNDCYLQLDSALSIADSEKVDVVLHAVPLNFSMSMEGENDTELNVCDSFLNIKLPILAIHGGSDEPGGVGSISGLDVLAACGLVNKIESEETFLTPVLIVNDSVKVAVYGLYARKIDDIIQSMKEGILQVKKPDDEGWVSILIIHCTRGRIPLELFKEEFDVVIVGGNHKSNYQTTSRPYLCQPGSPFPLNFEGFHDNKSSVAKITVYPNKISIDPVFLDLPHKMYVKDIEIPPEYKTTDKEAVVDNFIEGALKEICDEIMAKDPNMFSLKLTFNNCSPHVYPNTKKIASKYSEHILNWEKCIKIHKFSVNIKRTDVTMEQILDQELNKTDEEKIIHRSNVVLALEQTKNTGNSSISITTEEVVEKVIKDAIDTKHSIMDDINNTNEQSKIQECVNSSISKMKQKAQSQSQQSQFPSQQISQKERTQNTQQPTDEEIIDELPEISQRKKGVTTNRPSVLKQQLETQPKPKSLMTGNNRGYILSRLSKK